MNTNESVPGAGSTRTRMGRAGPGGYQISGNSNDDKRLGAERDGGGTRAEFNDGFTVDPDRFRDLLTGPTEGSDPRAVAPLAEESERAQGRHSVAIVEDHLDLRSCCRSASGWFLG